MNHFEESVLVPAKPEEVFAYVDDFFHFSSHMNKSSWMTGGGKMETSVDEGGGKKVGSHIRMGGRAFGIPLYLDEVITQHQPPNLKAWETVGTPKLVVIGNYGMKVLISSREKGSEMTVAIDYDLPQTNVWLGKLFGKMYAKWCVRQMTKGVLNHFGF